jgi:electron transfer flavoprotein beta subunit
MGADKAVHVTDDGLAGSDALQTSAALAAAIGTLSVDLVITGNESTDGRTGSVPSMLAERLGLPQVTSVRSLEIDGTTVRAERVRDGGYSEVTATLPALVSVTEKINEPRYPGFKGIMAAKKKPVTVLGIADLGLDAAGLANAATVVLDAAPRPPKQSGEKVTDDGTGGTQATEFLAAARLI